MAVLKVSRDEASSRLTRFARAGSELVEGAQGIVTEVAYDQWSFDHRRWVRNTKAALLATYEGDVVANEFERSVTRTAYIGGTSWTHDFQWDVRFVEAGINTLVSFNESLEFDEAPVIVDALAPAQEVPTADEVAEVSMDDAVIFLVHGHATDVRETVARFLENAGRPKHKIEILAEQPNRGRTLIEKLEGHAGEAKYAVVLLTGDDTGSKKGATRRKPRARQNVVFELGYFCGLLGRRYVAVLHEPDVELPSDLDGLAYIPLDTAGAWKLGLAKELRDAGLDFDAHRA